MHMQPNLLAPLVGPWDPQQPRGRQYLIRQAGERRCILQPFPLLLATCFLVGL